ncbi:3-hydroxyacyl-ACP dehydratase FabZ [Rhodobacteraceae bacterium 2376]|uniref:3-hydroxyacyl-[acyl-carrier-protein] dehydratase FabZ n=1 Tax=Rhabdonatronobacter sediminivivens TaxID=2743469 RepID=A0A7Z0KYI3_9RHOB|nr:3-hydroxyacyl-ACP dehydratase FabZ [Rhabdonatronobacter sediminivivens]NYS24516.1 3-hydroxyacyl-ACP dehydratase FabZ [Rhabdonatronobacter sediminivivens]
MTTDAEQTPQTADLDLIMRIIPHRYPFLLVDKVRDVVANTSATGIKNVTFNEPHFQGHFPGAPIMPGVTIIEAMAQTSAVLVGLSQDLVDKKPLVYFMNIDKAKFRRKVVPGDVLEMHIKVLRASTKVWKFEGTAMVEGEVAASAEFAAMIDRNARVTA